MWSIFSRSAGDKAARDVESRKCHADWYLSGKSPRFGIFQRRGTHHQCGINQWIYPQLCSEIFLYYFNAIIGALCTELGQFASNDMTIGCGFMYVLGIIVSAVVGYLLRTLLKLVNRIQFRYFAYYCLLLELQCWRKLENVANHQLVGGMPEHGSSKNQTAKREPQKQLEKIQPEKKALPKQGTPQWIPDRDHFTDHFGCIHDPGPATLDLEEQVGEQISNRRFESVDFRLMFFRIPFVGAAFFTSKIMQKQACLQKVWQLSEFFYFRVRICFSF